MSDIDLHERRGPSHCPDVLEICTTCLELRGPYRGHDNVCACDVEAWEPDRPARAGDLTNNVILCHGCLAELVEGSSRWSSFYCDPCRTWVRDTGRRLGRYIVPIGRHSIMNGTYWLSEDGQLHTDAQVTAFADQLSASFASIDALYQLTNRRLRSRLTVLGIDGDAIEVTAYLQRCAAHGWTDDTGLHEFAELVLQSDARPIADELIADHDDPDQIP